MKHSLLLLVVVVLGGCTEIATEPDRTSTPMPVLAASPTITVGDNFFTPSTASVSPQGGTATWSFTGANLHSITDNLGLFDSGLLPQGSTFSQTFNAAGRYTYICTAHRTQGAIRVPIRAGPSSGLAFDEFTITWATGAPPTGYVYDVQIARACGFICSGPFTAWIVGTLQPSATFMSDAGVVGPYQFRARLRNTASGKTSGYSLASTIRVTSTAFDDQAQTTQDTPLDICVGCNDSWSADAVNLRVTDQEWDEGRQAFVVKTALGKVINPDDGTGVVRFEPHLGATGADSFTYDWTDYRSYDSNVATVEIQID